MNKDELKLFFDQLASSYEKQVERMAPINQCLYFLLESIFSDLRSNAQILCVGAGTGQEVIHLAKHFPNWSFTIVEPSAAMLAECRWHLDRQGLTSRCYFHEDYLDSLPANNLYDAATCFLVSHFMMEKEARTQFFHSIANRLQPDGILVSSDMAYDDQLISSDALFSMWQKVMSGSTISSESLSQMKSHLIKHVALLSPKEVAAIMQSGGFDTPVQFFQSGLIHAWFAKRATSLKI